MDVLSEVLKAVKLEGAVFFNAEFSAPWCIRSGDSGELAPHLRGRAGHLIIFHFLTEGHAYARLPAGEREELEAGDIVVVPHGDVHLLGNGWPEKPVDSVKTFAKNLADGLKAVRFGGGGEITRFVCGYLACDRRLCAALLGGLPRILKVRVGGDPSGALLEHGIRFSVESAAADPGAGVVLSKLAETLFLETVRRYISGLPAEETGWLAGARDEVVGQALGLMHRDPAFAWTVSHLARRVGASRTRLAERFRHYLDESPMAYLARWRLKLGAEMLDSSERSVAEVATAVGYASEAAFNRAFKREFGAPPAQFRRARKMGTAG